MAKIITVIGATGIQGGSVVRALLKSQDYSIRAITRSPQSDTAKALASQGVEVVQADINNLDSLKAAFVGSHAIFANTNFAEGLAEHGTQKCMEIETRLGISLADAAAATPSLEHYVWSSLPNARQNSGGEVLAPYYESKNRVDAHIRANRDLLAKTTILWLSWYPGNIMAPMFRPVPVPALDGTSTYVQLLCVPPTASLPMLGDEQTNPGLFVKAILEQPGKTRSGKIVSGVVERRSLAELLSMFGGSNDVRTLAVQISPETFLKLWPGWDSLGTGVNYLAKYQEKAFPDSGDNIMSVHDLGIKGLVGTAEYMERVRL